MRKWSSRHRSLFAFTAFAFICCAAFYFLMIRPLQLKIASDMRYIDETQSKLRSSGWPLDSERLQKLLEHQKNSLERPSDAQSAYRAIGIKTKSTLLLEECTDVFNQRIKKIFVNPSDFVTEITRLDFQDEYNSIRNKLESKSIFFSEESLNIGNDTGSRQIYPLMLQIWLLDEVLSLALKNSLNIESHPEIRVRTDSDQMRNAAKIKMLPVRSYSLHPKDDKPYVMEFPVRLSMRGTINQFSGFLRDLNSGGKFFPVSRIQVKAVPDFRETETDISLNNTTLEIEVECSAFFRSSDSVPETFQKEKIKIIPAGA